MTRARVQLEPAWVLRAAPYRDTSLLLECLSRDRGRVGVVARGARGPKSRSRALLQAFRPLLLSWTESGDLCTLTAVEAAGAPLNLAGERVFSGWYLNELLLRLLQRHDAHAQVFEAYGDAIAALAVDAGPGEAGLRRFELRLLAELGFGLELPADLHADRTYRLDLETGLQEVAGDHREALRGAHLIALRDNALSSEDALRAARRLLRAALAPLLGARPLASASMLRELRLRRIAAPRGLSAG